MSFASDLESSTWSVVRSNPNPPGGDVLAIVAPHPDDESIGPGGSAILEAEHRPVIVLYLTEGARGISGKGGEAAIRREEARAAIEAMGIAAGLWMGYSSEDVKTRSRSLIEDLSGIIKHFGVKELWIPSPYEHHPTHVSTTVCALHALESLPEESRPSILRGYGVWDPVPSGPDTLRRAITSVLDRKRQSILVHKSQCSVRPLDEAIFGLNRYEGLFQETTGQDNGAEWVESFLDMSSLIGQSPKRLCDYVRERLESRVVKRLRDAME